MEILKFHLTNAPCLAFADFSEGASDFILDCDFSAKHSAIGAVGLLGFPAPYIAVPRSWYACSSAVGVRPVELRWCPALQSRGGGVAMDRPAMDACKDATFQHSQVFVKEGLGTQFLPMEYCRLALGYPGTKATLVLLNARAT